MIRSLYVRIVVTFMLIVAIGLTVSFLITKTVYDGELLRDKQNEMLDAGGRIRTRLEQLTFPEMKSYLDGLSAVGTYKFTLIREGETQLPVDSPVGRDRIDPVLHGGEYRSEGAGWMAIPNEVVVGMPFQADGIRYGLWMELSFKEVSRSFSMVFAIFRSVLTVKLLIGCLLILIASGYLVRPIKKLTAATKKIADGQYDVERNHMAKQLRQVERMRQDFVSDVSHELQSPLRSIRGFAAALAKDDLPAARYRLDEQLRRTIIAAEPMWSSKQLELDLALEEAAVTADPDQMTQVWTNLLANSVKFTPTGGRITVTLRRQTKGIAVTVADTGIGIPEQDIDRIFDRFYKVDLSRDRSRGGSGLELAVVRKIIDIHNGSIGVHSEFGKGTAITVTLPDNVQPKRAIRELKDRDTLVHPDGRTVTFLDQGLDERGDYLLVEHKVTRPGAMNGPHWHPALTDSFAVKEGRMRFLVDGQEYILDAGGQMTIYPNQVHQFWKIGVERLVAVHEIRPPGMHRTMFELIHKLEIEGKMNRKGIPMNPLWLGLAWKCIDGYVVGPPPIVQKVFLGGLARIAKAFGYRI